jgi:hypothetical protein
MFIAAEYCNMLIVYGAFGESAYAAVEFCAARLPLRQRPTAIAICVLRAQSDTLSIERLLFSRNRQCTFALATHTRFFLQSEL